MFKSSLCDYSDAYILVKGTIAIAGAGANAAVRNPDEINKQVIFKNCVPFTDCFSLINNNQVNSAKDLYAVMPMNNLIEYSDGYKKLSGILWQHHKDDSNDNIADSNSFIFKARIAERNLVAGTTKDDEISMPLKYLSSFWRTI